MDSLLNAIDKNAMEELNNEAKNFLENFPKIEQKADEIDDQSEESKIIQAFQDVDIKKNYIKYDDPWDPLSTVLKMSFADPILYSYLKHQFSLRDQNDYGEIKKSVFSPLNHTFVYIGAYLFYKRYEGESTITFASSSGLPNPLERYGTDEFVQKYSVPPDAVVDLLLKNPYRIDNFTKGILNDKINWEKNMTSKALKEALHKVPEDKRQKFLDDAIKLLAEAFIFNNLRIYEQN